MASIGKTHQNNIKRMAFCYPLFECINRQSTVLRNLYLVSVLVEDLNGQLLVHDIVLCQQDIEAHARWRCDGANGIGLERRYQG